MAMPRKRPLQDSKQFYAYVWRLFGQVLIVGQGRNNRGRPTTKQSWSGRPPELVDVLEKHRFSVEVEIRPCQSKEESIDLERQLIAELQPLYNKAPQAGGWSGMHTSEGLDRIRKAATGRPVSDELKAARSARMIGNQNLLGYQHSEETRAKISEANKGRQPSELARQKARERMIARNKLNPPRKGKLCSSEHRQKISESRRKNASQIS